MAFDGVMMHYVKEEIKSVALDARVSQIHQPNRDELVIALRTCLLYTSPSPRDA